MPAYREELEASNPARIAPRAPALVAGFRPSGVGDASDVFCGPLAQG